MSQSSTLFIGMDVHPEAIAVAYVAQDHGAEGTYLRAVGIRQGDIDQLMRTMQSKAPPLVFVYEAGPWGDGLYRSLMKKGDDCWVVAPSLIPKKPGAWVKTDRRDAVPLARLARSGDLTAVSVPAVDDEAIRDLTRAREDTISDCKDAKLRLNAFLLRHASRSTGRAHGGSAPRLARLSPQGRLLGSWWASPPPRLPKAAHTIQTQAVPLASACDPGRRLGTALRTGTRGRAAGCRMHRRKMQPNTSHLVLERTSPGR